MMRKEPLYAIAVLDMIDGGLKQLARQSRRSQVEQPDLDQQDNVGQS